MPEFATATRSATPEDQEFLKQLFVINRTPEFEAAGVSGPALANLLDQQFQAMLTHYRREFPDADYQIIEAYGKAIGYYATVDMGSHHILDIALVPEVRGQGIGTYYMRQIMEQGRATNRDVTLSVEVFNPALRLYERLGFVAYDVRDVYQRMRWTAH